MKFIILASFIALAALVMVTSAVPVKDDLETAQQFFGGYGGYGGGYGRGFGGGYGGGYGGYGGGFGRGFGGGYGGYGGYGR